MVATYGKKKSGFLPSFSIFHDEKPAILQPLVSRKASSKITTQLSKTHSPDAEDGSDELVSSAADEADESPIHDRTLGQSASLRQVGSFSNEPILEHLEKPLPSLPEAENIARAPTPPRVSSKHVLGLRSTNPKVIGPRSKQGNKLKISAPILQDKSSLPPDSNLRSLAGATLASRPSTGILPPGDSSLALDAAELSRKISALMEQVAIDERNMMPKVAIVKDASKASKGKKLPAILGGTGAFGRARQAISGRLSTTGSRKGGSKTSGDTSSGTGTVEVASPAAKSGTNQTQTTFSRRIAEGENLNNPKIRSLTGDGTVPRKPLPVYDSMKTLPSTRALKHRSYSLDDPFIDELTGNGRPSPSLAAFDFDFNKPKSKRLSTQGSESTVTFQAVDPIEESRNTLVEMLEKPQPRFTDTISGLAQHSNLLEFSSSPVGYSTPRSRFESGPSSSTAPAAKNLKAPAASILNFSFEEQSEEDAADLKQDELRNSVTSLSLSLKRKTGKANLRDESSPITKKLKNSEEASEKVASLPSMTALPSVVSPLAAKNKNKLLKKFMGADAKLHKRLDKTISPRKEAGNEKKGKGNAAVAKRSLFSKVSAFRPSHHRRASTSMLGDMLREDSMSIDELQREESM